MMIIKSQVSSQSTCVASNCSCRPPLRWVQPCPDCGLLAYSLPATVLWAELTRCSVPLVLRRAVTSAPYTTTAATLLHFLLLTSYF